MRTEHGSRGVGRSRPGSVAGERTNTAAAAAVATGVDRKTIANRVKQLEKQRLDLQEREVRTYDTYIPPRLR